MSGKSESGRAFLRECRISCPHGPHLLVLHQKWRSFVHPGRHFITTCLQDVATMTHARLLARCVADAEMMNAAPQQADGVQLQEYHADTILKSTLESLHSSNNLDVRRSQKLADQYTAGSGVFIVWDWTGSLVPDRFPGSPGGCASVLTGHSQAVVDRSLQETNPHPSVLPCCMLVCCNAATNHIYANINLHCTFFSRDSPSSSVAAPCLCMTYITT